MYLICFFHLGIKLDHARFYGAYVYFNKYLFNATNVFEFRFTCDDDIRFDIVALKNFTGFIPIMVVNDRYQQAISDDHNHCL